MKLTTEKEKKKTRHLLKFGKLARRRLKLCFCNRFFKNNIPHGLLKTEESVEGRRVVSSNRHSPFNCLRSRHNLNTTFPKELGEREWRERKRLYESTLCVQPIAKRVVYARTTCEDRIQLKERDRKIPCSLPNRLIYYTRIRMNPILLWMTQKNEPTEVKKKNFNSE